MFPRRSARLAMKEKVDYCELSQKKSTKNEELDHSISRKKLRLENGNIIVTQVENDLVNSITNLHICEAPFKEPHTKMITHKIIPSNDLINKDVGKEILTKLLNDIETTADLYGSIIMIANIIYNCPSVIENDAFRVSIIQLGLIVSDQFLKDSEVSKTDRVRDVADAISILLSL